jgi:hypothetical protein
MKVGHRIFTFDRTPSVNDAGFKNHVFGQQGFAGLGRSQQNNVLNEFFVVDFHVRVVYSSHGMPLQKDADDNPLHQMSIS